MVQHPTVTWDIVGSSPTSSATLKVTPNDDPVNADKHGQRCIGLHEGLISLG